MAKKQAADSGTAARILDVAEELVQRRGFNGFSYADIAAELKITTASLHYHYPGKAELGRALIDRYATRFIQALADIDADSAEPLTQLESYAGLYAAVLQDHRFCLCGMLAAEYETLPEPMRYAVIHFFDQNETWLAHVLKEGRERGTLQFTGAPVESARMIVSALEGALLVARPYGEVSRFNAAVAQLLTGLAAPTSVPS